MTDEIDRVAELGWHVPVASADGVIRFESSVSGGMSFPDEGLEVLSMEVEGNYWFDHRATAVAACLTRLRVSSMWDVGSGTGAMAGRLRPSLVSVVAVEPQDGGARLAAARGLPSLCATLQDLRLPDGCLECIGAFDVIEHVRDVDSLLKEARRVLQPNGLVIVTVPAFNALWGDEDDFAQHLRRYSRPALVEQFAHCGFRAVHVEYLFASLVLPALVTRAVPYRLGVRRSPERVLDKMQVQLSTTGVVGRIAKAVLRSEEVAARKFDLPLGLSLLGAFRVA